MNWKNVAVYGTLGVIAVASVAGTIASIADTRCKNEVRRQIKEIGADPAKIEACMAGLARGYMSTPKKEETKPAEAKKKEAKAAA